MNQSSSRIDFLPHGYLDARAQRRSILFGVSLLGIILVVVAAIWPMTQRSIHQWQTEHDETNRQLTAATQRLNRAQQLEQQASLAQQAELAVSLLERIPRSKLLMEVAAAIPAGASLNELTMQSKAQPQPAVQAAKPGVTTKTSAPLEPPNYDVTVRLVGIAASNQMVAELLANLARSSIFKDVNLVVTDQVTPGGEQRRFEIELSVEPNNGLPMDSRDAIRTATVELDPQ